jgi:hypothetical protein
MCISFLSREQKSERESEVDEHEDNFYVVFYRAFGSYYGCCAYPRVVRALTHCVNPPAGGRLLMLVPQDFERFVYVSAINGTRTHHSFGEQATDELEAQLRPFFSSITVERVDSEAAARERLASGDYDQPDSRYDLIAVPEFRDVDSWIRGDLYGFSIDMRVKFYTPDESKVSRIRGRGESKVGFYGSSPGESGSLAVRKAVEAVVDGVCQEGKSML